jgi:hypothetical protein
VAYKRQFIWVEGPDDQLFFDKVVKPLFVDRYDQVEIRTYADQSKTYLDRFLVSIKAMGADYFLVGDINSTPCITARKERLLDIYKKVDENMLQIVIKEIESWYLAGLNEAALRQFGLPLLNNTNQTTKEDFNRLIPKRFTARIDFLQEILKLYSADAACRKNASFQYFIDKHIS